MSDEIAPKFDRRSYWEMSPEKGTMGTWVQKRRLASAMRQVIGRLVQSNAPEAELRTAADALERYAERLAGHPRLKRTRATRSPPMRAMSAPSSTRAP